MNTRCDSIILPLVIPLPDRENIEYMQESEGKNKVETRRSDAWVARRHLGGGVIDFGVYHRPEAREEGFGLI